MWPILKRPSAFSKMRHTAAVNIILEATAHLPGRCMDDYSCNRAVFKYLNLHSFFSKLFAWVDTWNCGNTGHISLNQEYDFLQKMLNRLSVYIIIFARKRGAFCVLGSALTEMLSLFIINAINEKCKQPQQIGKEKFDACLVNSQFHVNICQ